MGCGQLLIPNKHVNCIFFVGGDRIAYFYAVQNSCHPRNTFDKSCFAKKLLIFLLVQIKVHLVALCLPLMAFVIWHLMSVSVSAGKLGKSVRHLWWAFNCRCMLFRKGQWLFAFDSFVNQCNHIVETSSWWTHEMLFGKWDDEWDRTPNWLIPFCPTLSSIVQILVFSWLSWQTAHAQPFFEPPTQLFCNEPHCRKICYIAWQLGALCPYILGRGQPVKQGNERKRTCLKFVACWVIRSWHVQADKNGSAEELRMRLRKTVTSIDCEESFFIFLFWQHGKLCCKLEITELSEKEQCVCSCCTLVTKITPWDGAKQSASQLDLKMVNDGKLQGRCFNYDMFGVSSTSVIQKSRGPNKLGALDNCSTLAHTSHACYPFLALFLISS